MTQNAKKVAVSLPNPLYEAVERARKTSGKSRSAIIQDALRHWPPLCMSTWPATDVGRKAAAVRLLSTEDWQMRRGEVWWADLPAPAGRRPVALLSRNEAYTVREVVTVAPVTRRARGIPTEVPLGPAEGLPKPCVVNLDTIIPRRTLTQPIGPLRPPKLVAVARALMFALGLTH